MKDRESTPRIRLLALTAGLLLLVPVVAVVAQSRSRVPQKTLDQIQRECLRAYPAEIRAKMASGVEEIPPEVDANPKAQMQFLDKELEVEKGLFYPSLLEELLPTFEEHITEGTRFLDLGSGDGRVLFLANVLGAEATGMEWDDEFVNVSLRALDALDDIVDASRIEIIQGDFFESSWALYDVIFYFDTSSLEHERLRKKMMEELLPEALLIVGHEIVPFEGFELVADRVPRMKIYRVPR